MHHIFINVFSEQVFNGMIAESDLTALPITFIRSLANFLGGEGRLHGLHDGDRRHHTRSILKPTVKDAEWVSGLNAGVLILVLGIRDRNLAHIGRLDEVVLDRNLVALPRTRVQNKKAFRLDLHRYRALRS